MTQRRFRFYERKTVEYKVPDIDGARLRGLLQVLATAYANGWEHLAALVSEQVRKASRGERGD
jgi:hypothetical protein